MEDRKPAVWPFWVATAFWLAGVALWIALHWTSVVAWDGGKLADAATGATSPLAFFWLLYAALAQRAELGLQRNELRQSNATQQFQHEQMKRQADALAAQADRLRAQADASYQPIFVLRNIDYAADGARLEVMNRGNHILDVRGVDHAEMVAIGSSSVGMVALQGNLVAHWPKDFPAEIRLVGYSPGDAPDIEFSIELTRLDLIRVRYRLRLLRNETRLRVIAVDELPQAPGT